MLVLVGRSGAGKSTILKLVNGLLPPTTGAVRVEGRDTRTWDGIRLRRRIGYVLQDVGLFPHMTVGDNVGVVPRLERWPVDADARARARAARAGRPARRHVRPPLPARAVGRPAAARRPGARACRRPADPADGRAVRRARSGDACRGARRVHAHQGRARHDRGRGHARHGRGLRPRRAHRRHRRGPAHRLRPARARSRASTDPRVRRLVDTLVGPPSTAEAR